MADRNLQKINEVLTRGVEEIFVREHLEKALLSGKKLTIKLGIDPTSPNIHIGRAVVLWKLRSLQELGHKVVFIVGDFTGLIGDTSDKEAERPMLSEGEVKKNLKTYFTQAFKILDKSKTKTYYNSSWLKKLGFKEIGVMADLFGLHEFEARENISKRLKAGKRVSLRELLYPLMQGYDSVFIKADIELGGTDQKFNLLAGRTLQKHYKQIPQDIIITSILEGTDGRKMSSSWGNVINITDEPNNMFGKVMSLPDSLIEKYFLLCTRVSQDEIKKVLNENKNPRDSKMCLAHEITNLYHGTKLADVAKENFVSVFQKKNAPKDVVEISINNKDVAMVLIENGIVLSKTELRRLIQQGAVTHMETSNNLIDLDYLAKNKGTYKIGSRRFIKIVG
ncbi:MAG: tyrosine--tRNA ligase [Patescibacteria group bacterium]